MATIPTDAKFSDQWHLLNTTIGEYDLNVVDVWDDYTGDGVTITVIDSGFDYAHSDLSSNYDTALDWDFADNDADAWPSAAFSGHGTAVMGLVGADKNGSGAVGVAHEVDLIGFRTDFTLSATADAINATANSGNAHYRATDIVVMSLSTSSVFNTSADYVSMVGDFAYGAANGRGGLGTVYVKSAGNDRGLDDTNAEMRDASIHTITVGATLADGNIADYSTPGASVLVSAFGSLGGSGGTIFTTDQTGTAGYNTETSGNGGDFHSGFNGTSAATPMVGGVIALMLEANDQLGWRDVQTILAYSARHVGSAVGSAATGNELSSGAFGSAASWLWNDATDWNGGGLHFSNDYGFGLIDAKAAVRLAETWQITSTSANDATTFEDNVDSSFLIPDGGFTSFTISETTGILIEHLTIELALDIDDLGDLEIHLTSPSGTTSKLIADIGGTAGFADRWTFSSNAFRGENSDGDWILQVRDDQVDGQRVTVTDADLMTFGAALSDNDQFILTEELSDFAGVAGHAATFAGGAGTNILNAAAISSDMLIDLFNNSGTVDGVAITNSNIQIVYTGDGNDTIIGDNSSDELYAGNGNDTIVVHGQIGGNLYDGGDGVDTIDWSGATETDITFDMNDETATSTGGGVDQMRNFENLSGTNNADVIISRNFGSNTIMANGGDDIIHKLYGTGSAISDDYNGGAGTDTLVALRLQVDVVVDLMAGEILHQGASRDQLTEIENITIGDGAINGDNGANVLISIGDFANSIQGNGGNDVIDGGDGDDVLGGGAGGDAIFGGLGSDTIHGGSGADTIDAGEGMDVVHAGSGNDTIIDTQAGGLTNNDTYNGGAGIDTLVVNSASWTAVVVFNLAAGEETINGTVRDTYSEIENITASGSATLIGDNSSNRLIASDLFTSGDNAIQGNGGDDFIDGGAGNDALDGGAGDDEILGGLDDDVLHGNGGNDTLSGGVGNDSVYGDVGDDIITVGSGLDFADGGGGNDRISRGGGDALEDEYHGGAGIDTIDVTGGTFISSVLFDLGTGELLISGTLYEIWEGFENYDGSGGTGSEGVNGTSGGNVIITGSGSNVINAGSGADIVDAGAGMDVVNVGAGNDFVTDNDGLTGDVFVGGGGIDTLDYSGNFFTNGVTFDAVLGYVGVSGGALADDLFSNFEIIIASQGADILISDGLGEMHAEDGDDTVYAGIGTAEVLDGGLGADTLNTTSFAADYQVNLATGLTSHTGEAFTNFENLILGDGNDTATGTAGDNEIFGGKGNDTVFGGAGQDILTGGLNKDTLKGEGGDDILNGGGGADYLYGGGNSDLITGANGHDRLFGGGGKDILIGGLGDDKLKAGGGADILKGGGGNDKLWGGAGNDDFVFTNGFGTDIIKDFNFADNREDIDLSGVTEIVGFADLKNHHLSEVNGNSIITVGMDTITIIGVLNADFDRGDFLF